MSLNKEGDNRESTASVQSTLKSAVASVDIAGEDSQPNSCYEPTPGEKRRPDGRVNCTCCQDPETPPDVDPKKAAQDGTQFWKLCSDKARKNDEDVAKAWKEEIDALLVFAGLFSAVLTSFIVEVYSQLVPNQPSSDPNTQILLRIATHLERLSATDSSGALTFNPVVDMARPDVGALTQPSSALITINALWFTSLILSLSASCIGLIVRQWLNHFISPIPADPIASTYIHCLRWYMGFVAWHVSGTLSILPILLQLAVILFLVGLIVLLWSLSFAIAGIATPLVVLLFCFITWTTLVPIWKPKCPYKSPQALFACWTVDWIHSLYRWLLGCGAKVLDKIPGFPKSRAHDVLDHLKDRADGHRKVYRTWISQEQGIVEDFVRDVVERCMKDQDQHDAHDSVALRRFQRFTEEMQQPLTYAGRDAVGKITIDSASQIPDRFVCEFATTTGEWLVHNVPLTRGSLVQLVTLANRVYHQDDEHKRAIGKVLNLMLRRQPLVLALIMDDWHAEVDGSSLVDHEFVDYMIGFARWNLDEATTIIKKAIRDQSGSHHSAWQRGRIVAAEHSCSLAMQFTNLLPTPCIHANLQRKLEDFERDLWKWRNLTVDLNMKTVTQPANKYFQHIQRRIKAYHQITLEPEPAIRRNMQEQLEKAERRMAGSKIRAEQPPASGPSSSSSCSSPSPSSSTSTTPAQSPTIAGDMDYPPHLHRFDAWNGSPDCLTSTARTRISEPTEDSSGSRPPSCSPHACGT